MSDASLRALARASAQAGSCDECHLRALERAERWSELADMARSGVASVEQGRAAHWRCQAAVAAGEPPDVAGAAFRVLTIAPEVGLLLDQEEVALALRHAASRFNVEEGVEGALGSAGRRLGWLVRDAERTYGEVLGVVSHADLVRATAAYARSGPVVARQATMIPALAPGEPQAYMHGPVIERDGLVDRLALGLVDRLALVAMLDKAAAPVEKCAALVRAWLYLCRARRILEGGRRPDWRLSALGQALVEIRDANAVMGWFEEVVSPASAAERDAAGWHDAHSSAADRSLRDMLACWLLREAR